VTDTYSEVATVLSAALRHSSGPRYVFRRRYRTVLSAASLSHTPHATGLHSLTQVLSLRIRNGQKTFVYPGHKSM